MIKAIRRIDRWAMHHGRNRLGAIGVWLLAVVFFTPFAFAGLAIVWGIPDAGWMILLGGVIGWWLGYEVGRKRGREERR